MRLTDLLAHIDRPRSEQALYRRGWRPTEPTAQQWGIRIRDDHAPSIVGVLVVIDLPPDGGRDAGRRWMQVAHQAAAVSGEWVGGVLLSMVDDAALSQMGLARVPHS